MIEDTSSRPLREWFEASPEPDAPDTWLGLSRIDPTPLKINWTKGGRRSPSRPFIGMDVKSQQVLKPGEIMLDGDGKPIGMVQSVDAVSGMVTVMIAPNVQPFVDGLRKVGQSIGTHMHAVMDGLKASAKVYSDFAQSAGIVPEQPKEETVRERALRLKQQPHSMTGKDGKFDSHGRCRY